MRNIPQCFYNKNLVNLVDRLIREGYKSYSNLDELDQELITAQCIEILGTDAYSCIIESENFTKLLSHFTKFLRTAKSEHKQDLVEVMSKNATEYFADDMNQLFDERLNVRHCDDMHSNGFIPYIDSINGEMSWRKSV